MFSISLQRDTIDISGHQGVLSIGELPPGITADQMTWTDVRGYPTTQGGLHAPLESPTEVSFLDPRLGSRY
jgi:hypothetical protein